tara:strand:- start:1349 stop:2413 length:1065 start_codon:yes stop_codon:yes gene_type:complete
MSAAALQDEVNSLAICEVLILRCKKSSVDLFEVFCRDICSCITLKESFPSTKPCELAGLKPLETIHLNSLKASRGSVPVDGIDLLLSTVEILTLSLTEGGSTEEGNGNKKGKGKALEVRGDSTFVLACDESFNLYFRLKQLLSSEINAAYKKRCLALMHLLQPDVDTSSLLQSPDRVAEESIPIDEKTPDTDITLQLSLVSNVTDILPDLGAGFVASCLDHFGVNQNGCEQIINNILSDTLPDNLKSLDRNMTEQAYLSQRRGQSNVSSGKSATATNMDSSKPTRKQRRKNKQLLNSSEQEDDEFIQFLKSATKVEDAQSHENLRGRVFRGKRDDGLSTAQVKLIQMLCLFLQM